MELEVQKALRSGKTLDDLHNEYGLEVVYHKSLPLVIVNYSQIYSPKNVQLCKEARGLVLELDSYNVVARAFNRFFNFGENVEDTEQFDWSGPIYVNHKEDGSLMLLWWYDGSWHVSTRGSFADGLCGFSNKTWKELFLNRLDLTKCRYTNKEYTYVFEFVGPHNKVVRNYNEVDLYLLTAINNAYLTECEPATVDVIAKLFNVKRPSSVEVRSPEQLLAYLAERGAADPTFEGVVARDQNGHRLKFKTKEYLLLHRAKGNNGENLFNPKHIIPVILQGEGREVLTYFPEAEQRWREISSWMDAQLAQLKDIYDQAKELEAQKDFAQFILPRTKFASILFTARKTGRSVEEVWRQSENLIVKVYCRE